MKHSGTIVTVLDDGQWECPECGEVYFPETDYGYPAAWGLCRGCNIKLVREEYHEDYSEDDVPVEEDEKESGGVLDW